MNRNESIFIHPGFPKCGSTFLQNSIFSIHPQVDYIGPESWDNRGFNSMFMNVKTADYNPDAVRALFSSAGKTRILSVETLLGDPYLNPMAGEVYAKRLKDTFPHAKILLFIRSQPEALESLILQWVKTGWTGRMGVTDFFKPKKFYTDILQFDLSYFKYSQTIKLYQTYFGKENVKVFLFENFIKDVEGVVNQVLDFMGLEMPEMIDKAPVKRGMTLAGYLFMGVVNRYRTGKYNLKGGILDIIPWLYIVRMRNVLDNMARLSGLFPKYSWLKNDFRNQIKEYYREDNIMTKELTLYDLD